MKRNVLTLIILLFSLSIVIDAEAGFFTWRYREHATDCTSLTDGKNTDLCYEQDDGTVYKCDPTAGNCDTVGEWKAIGGGGSDTHGDGTSGDVTVTFDGDAGTDGTIVYDVSEDSFDIAQGISVNPFGSTYGTVDIYPLATNEPGLNISCRASMTVGCFEMYSNLGQQIIDIDNNGVVTINESSGSLGDFNVKTDNVNEAIFSDASADEVFFNAPVTMIPVNSTITPLTVKGAALQSANLTEWQDSSGTEITMIDGDGRIGIGATSSLAALNINPPTSMGSHIRFGGTTQPTTGSPIMMRVENAYDPQGALTTLTTLNNSTSISGSTSNNISTVVGNFARLNLIGSYGGTITNSRSFQINDANVTSTGSPTITNQVGILIADLTEGANGNRAMDLLVNSTSNGGYNIFASGTAPSYFVGNIGFNDFSPDAKIDIDLSSASDVGLIVEAHASQTANLTEWKDSSGNILYAIDEVGARTSEIQTVVVDYETATSTGDGKGRYIIYNSVGSANLVSVHAEVVTPGTTGTLDIQIHNIDNGVDMLSTKLTVNSGETGSDTATAAVINTSNDHVDKYDVLRFDIDAVHTTPAEGLTLILEFQPR